MFIYYLVHYTQGIIMTTTDDNYKAMEAAVTAMNSGTCLYDITIICTTDDHQAAYWMDRLSSGVCKGAGNSDSDSKFPMVLAVSEDWGAGGAGNGLGTLYAWQKACALATSKHGVDLQEALQQGSVSAALFHTAGKGTRMAPLPASENNNKPGVKLPFPNRMADGKLDSLTVLEAVVKQTGIYAKSRAGRLSVFWGDQVFLPTAEFNYKPKHHVDILCTLSDQRVTAEEWKAQGLEKYGVIACIAPKEGTVIESDSTLDAAQVEKVDHATATSLLGALGEIRQVGPSLGSFSLSAAMLTGLCNEFSTELTDKTAKLDSDPHFWMPLTLPKESYVNLMQKKGTAESEATSHYERVEAFKTKFDAGNLGLFGAVNVGKGACWWDYGLLKLYSKNSLVLLEDGSSSALLRKFLNVTSHQIDCTTEGVAVDDRSYIFGSKAKQGSIKNSILAGVQTAEINADGAIIVNCAAKKITAGPGAILYNLICDSDEGITAAAGQVMVSVTDEEGQSTELKSRMDIDGGKAWKVCLKEECGNDLSFEQVHLNNKQANIVEIQKKRQENYLKVSDELGF